jgi:putative CocE/NonD family hydrolase
MYFAEGGTLVGEIGPASTDTYAVDRTATTGVWSRYGKHLSGGMGPADYGDRAEPDRKLLCFTSAPLPVDTEVTGHPVAHVCLSCDREDGALFVYLQDVAPDGRVLMVTDGCLRLSMRKTSDAAPYRTNGPWRTGRSDDLEPVDPGEVMDLTFDLLPVSWLFRAGHRIRVAIAGADADNFVQVPEHGPPPRFVVHHGGDRPARVDLPVMGGA